MELCPVSFPAGQIAYSYTTGNVSVTGLTLSDAAVAHNQTILGDELAFVKAAIKKAGQFSNFQNRIAHGEPTINVIELKDQDGNQASRTIDCSIVQGKSHGPDPATDVSITRLANAAENFHRLHCLLTDALGLDKQHAKYGEQLRKLPGQADALSNHDSART
jgi:hypothetical protein